MPNGCFRWFDDDTEDEVTYFLLASSFILGLDTLLLLLVPSPCGSSGECNRNDRKSALERVRDIIRCAWGLRMTLVSSLDGWSSGTLPILGKAWKASFERMAASNVPCSFTPPRSDFATVLSHHQKAMLTLSLFSLFCRLCAWMHQWHPLIQPIYEG